MILVILGTQDKQFPRLLEAVDKCINDGIIKDRVVVQAGQTKYESKNMEIFDLVPAPEFAKLMDEADLVITHGGAGSILTAIKKGKKIIAAARLAKYKEHHNDHQKQIIGEFASRGYILELEDFDELGDMIKKIKKFKPKKFESNTKNMIKLIDDYIKDSDNTAWYHKYKEGILYLFFGGCTTLVNIISFAILRLFKIDVYISNGIAWILAVLFAFVTNKIFVFESKGKTKKETLREMISFFGFRVLSLLFDMAIMYLLIDIIHGNEIVAKVVSNVVVIILNYIFSKVFIFKK
ncbi:MAG: GtrA family protein [Bacilli bacterium]|nr:GtrA family protein [Bacilli bacterium]